MFADNRADLASRGASAAELLDCDLWWYRPAWLRHPPSEWPQTTYSMPSPIPEAKSASAHIIHTVIKTDILERFSNLARAYRVIAYMFRLIQGTRGELRAPTTIIEVEETDRVEEKIIVLTQKLYYAEEYICLLNKVPLPGKSPLLTLNPTLDEVGVMRINGRLAQSETLLWSEKFPILLPYASRLAALIIDGLMPSLYTAEKRWFCVFCVTLTAYSAQKLSFEVDCTFAKFAPFKRKELRRERTTFERPFHTTGVDFTGPFSILFSARRGSRVSCIM